MLICMAVAAYAGNLVFQREDWSQPSYASGKIIGVFLTMMLFSLLPAYAVWRVSKNAKVARLAFYPWMALLFLGIYAQPVKTRINQALDESMRQAAEATLKNYASGNFDGDNPMLALLDKEAAGKGPDAAGAAVAAQFTRETAQTEKTLEQVITQAGTVPMPDGKDPAAYDAKTTANDSVLRALDVHTARLRKSPDRIAEIARARNIPDVAKNRFLQDFSDGVSGILPLCLELDTSISRLFSSQRDIVQVLKANHGHWHNGDEGKAVLDDPLQQKEYDAYLAANLKAAEDVTKYQQQLLEQQTKNVKGLH